MSSEPAAVERQRDPVCGMSVRTDAARGEGLVTEHDGHSYYFCRADCLARFQAAPDRHVTSHVHAAEAAPAGTPAIDEGMRRWYESCSCCLSDAYPEVKATLDAERNAAAKPQAEAGICEVAEAEETPVAQV
jgi:YHS domain-containing protein